MRHKHGLFVVPALLAAVCLVLAGCGGGKSSGGGGAKSTKIEVFSWWTGPGEADGLKAMVADFTQKNPNIQFVNAAVAGGAGTNAKAVLASRLQAGDPPDSFQGHAGQELLDYIKAGQIEPLNFLYQQEGLNNVFPQQLIDQITYQGNIYSVPVNIHRANVLWFNPQVVKAAGIAAPPTTMAEFIADLGKVKATGKIPLAAAEQWTQKHLFETVLLADLGADGWNGLWKAGADWRSAGVRKAIADYQTLLGFENSDAASLTWQDASKLVSDGKAAFNVMGDWAYSYFKGAGKQPQVDYAWAAAPGTGGIYDWLSDSFTLPKGAKHRDATIAWLKECGSKSGQDAFNPLKGSIPARKDADTSKYTGYLAFALKEWQADKLAGSLTHGVVANNAWNTAIDTALGLFLKNKDAAKFQAALADAAQKNAA